MSQHRRCALPGRWRRRRLRGSQRCWCYICGLCWREFDGGWILDSKMDRLKARALRPDEYDDKGFGVLRRFQGETSSLTRTQLNEIIEYRNNWL